MGEGRDASSGKGRRTPGPLAVALALTLVAACSGRHAGGSAEAPPVRATPSGLPIPRYVSLKFDKVNARGGPGDDYKLLWVYRVRGLPLQVVAETEDWRRVCDPDGALVWVHRRTVNENHRTVMRTAPEDLLLRRQPSDAAAASTTLVGRAIADLKTCQGHWCRIAVGHASGWVKAGEVWGLAPTPQCRTG